MCAEPGSKEAKQVELGDFALDALGRLEGASSGDVGVAERLELAIAFYLGDKGAGRSGWGYPAFLREQREAPTTPVEVLVDSRRWQELEAEAERQGIGVGQLAQHAAIYFAAEFDAGRVTERILDAQR